MNPRLRRMLMSSVTAVGLTLPTGLAVAQDTGGAAESEGGDAVNVPSGSGTQTTITFTPGSTQSSSTYAPPVGFPPPGADLEGHLPSSSRATTDIGSSTDGFDLNQSRNPTPVLSGNKDGSFVLTGRSSGIPPVHTVKRGDTLWDLCATYYGNPWQWPKVWSYNPQIQNPHWIYPGDQVRMRLGSAVKGAANLTQGGFIDRRPLVPPDTVFLRSQGYIDDPKKDVWGELVGAREDQMLLGEGNNTYMVMRPGVDLRLGQLLTVFRTVRAPSRVSGARRPQGAIIKLLGTVKIDQWNPRTRVARGEIVESIDVIERGSKVAPIGRRFDVVPPRRNKVDLKARVLSSLYPHVYVGENQLVFVDRGSDDGLRPGNRLFVLKKGDSWRRSLQTAATSARERVRQDVQEKVEIEKTPLRGDERRFPEEIIGELRILRTRAQSSIALVTVSHREIKPGDRAVARKGY